jgi:hypothetical protein
MFDNNNPNIDKAITILTKLYFLHSTKPQL